MAAQQHPVMDLQPDGVPGSQDTEAIFSSAGSIQNSDDVSKGDLERSKSFEILLGSFMSPAATPITNAKPEARELKEKEFISAGRLLALPMQVGRHAGNETDLHSSITSFADAEPILEQDAAKAWENPHFIKSKTAGDQNDSDSSSTGSINLNAWVIIGGFLTDTQATSPKTAAVPEQTKIVADDSPLPVSSSLSLESPLVSPLLPTQDSGSEMDTEAFSLNLRQRVPVQQAEIRGLFSSSKIQEYSAGISHPDDIPAAEIDSPVPFSNQAVAVSAADTDGVSFSETPTSEFQVPNKGIESTEDFAKKNSANSGDLSEQKDQLFVPRPSFLSRFQVESAETAGRANESANSFEHSRDDKSDGSKSQDKLPEIGLKNVNRTITIETSIQDITPYGNAVTKDVSADKNWSDVHPSLQPIQSPDIREENVTPVKEVTLHLQGNPGETLRVRVLDQGSQVQIAVRSSDSSLASTLRQDLPSLINNLDRAGWKTESVVTPALPSTILADNQQGARSGNEEQGGAARSWTWDDPQQNQRHSPSELWDEVLGRQSQ